MSPAFPAAAISWPSVVLGSFLSVLLGALLRALWLKTSGAMGGWYAKRGEIRGTWYAILGAYEGSPERIDKMTVRQRGQRLSGQIRRMRPAGNQQSWKFVGYIHGNAVVVVFYTTSPKEDPTSYGAINVHRDPSKPGLVYRGYYTRPDFEPYEAFVGGGLRRRPIVWQRPNPDAERC